MGLIILGVIVLIGAIAVIIVSLRRNAQGEEDDPLQARLAEFIQRGDVTSLEEIELSQPFSERVIVPVIRRVGEFSARFTPQKAIQDTARKLELAGNPWPVDAATFLAIRFILAVVLGGFLVAVVIISPPSNPSDNFMYIGGATFAGFFLLAATVWTPMLVGSTVLLGEGALRKIFAQTSQSLVAFLSIFVFMNPG